MKKQKDVFINCAFDAGFHEMFMAIAFTVQDCGFRARCAKELADANKMRWDNIVKLMNNCSLSIHDISMVELDSTTQMPRFNMPYELGLCHGIALTQINAKHSIVLERTKHDYDKCLSDLSGVDTKAHDGKVDEVINVIRDWLFHYYDGRKIALPSGAVIVNRFKEFRVALDTVCVAKHVAVDHLCFKEYVQNVNQWLQLHARPIPPMIV